MVRLKHKGGWPEVSRCLKVLFEGKTDRHGSIDEEKLSGREGERGTDHHCQAVVLVAQIRYSDTRI